MILQRIEKMGIVEKRELLERLKALIAKKMAGSTLAGKPKRYPRRTSADLFCKGHSAQGYHRGKCCSCGRTFLAKMESALKSPRSAHVVCCQAEGLSLDESLAGSRARLAVQMRDSTQATAILCTQAAYQV